MVFENDRAGLDSLLNRVTQASELSHFTAVVHGALQDLAILHAVLEHVRQNPGALQKSFGKALNIDGPASRVFKRTFYR
jgi:hypothetical protein